MKYADDDAVLLPAVGALQNLLLDAVVNRSRAVDQQALFILTRVYFNTQNAVLQDRILAALKNMAGNAL